MARSQLSASAEFSSLEGSGTRQFAFEPPEPEATPGPGMSRSQKLGVAQSIGGGVSAISIFMQAGIQKQNLGAAIAASEAKRAERGLRHNLNVRLLRKQAKRSVAGKQEAFIKGGVKLEGSAIDVVNDTLIDLLQAELNKEQEQAFLNEQSAIEEANLRSRREQVDTVAAMNAASSILGSYGGTL